MKNMALARKLMVGTIKKTGVAKVKVGIAIGKIKRDTPVDLMKEVDNLRNTVFSDAQAAHAVGILGLTDNDWEYIMRDICKKCGLKIKEQE